MGLSCLLQLILLAWVGTASAQPGISFPQGCSFNWYAFGTWANVFGVWNHADCDSAAGVLRAGPQQFIVTACTCLLTTAPGPVGQFLGVTGEDLVGAGDGNATPNGVPDWHLRVSNVKSNPVAIRIDALDAMGNIFGVWRYPSSPANWVIVKQLVPGLVLELWIEPYLRPVTFTITVTYLDGSSDTVQNIGSGFGP